MSIMIMQQVAGSSFARLEHGNELRETGWRTMRAPAEQVRNRLASIAIALIGPAVGGAPAGNGSGQEVAGGAPRLANAPGTGQRDGLHFHPVRRAGQQVAAEASAK